jgi:lysyl-tRNA synthetase class 1
LAYLVKLAPAGTETKYVTQKLREYGYIGGEEPPPNQLTDRIEYALHWNQDFTEIKETPLKLTTNEGQAISELIAVLHGEADADTLQSAIFDTARQHNVPPHRLFKTLYRILLGASKGPRLGPYIVSMGAEKVAKALKRALKTKG